MKHDRDQNFMIRIREMQACDGARVRELFTQVYRETFPGEVPDFTGATEWERILVAESESAPKGEIIGMVSVWEPDRFIHFLLVDARAKRRGVGRALVEAAAARYGYPLSLKCLLANEAALAFYLATGWEQTGEGDSPEGPYALLKILS